MPQFDFVLLFSITFSLYVCWIVYYSFFSLTLFSEILIIAKFRAKLSNLLAIKGLNKVSLPSFFLYRNYWVKKA